MVSDCSAAAALEVKSGSPELNRWLNRISKFEFEVRHRLGVSMGHVDALSRAPYEEESAEPEEDLPTDTEVELVRMIRVEDGYMRTVQAKDEWIRKRLGILAKDEQAQDQE